MEKDDRDLSDAPEYGRTGRILLDTVAEAILNTTIFVFRFIAWTFRWSVATVVMLIVMAAAGLFVFNQAVVGGEPVRVPDIQNMYLREAEAVLIERGLVMGTPSLVASDEVPPNVILSQRPKAGDVIRSGRKVYPSVSRGTKEVQVPDVVGLSLAEAGERLQQAGLRIGPTAKMPHGTMRDTVIGQDPPFGSETDQGQIKLLVSSGASSGTMMPSLIGLTQAEAATMLSRQGIVGKPIQVNRPDAEPDVVVDQRPAAGTVVSPEETVEFDVATSTETEAEEGKTYKERIPVTIPGSGTTRRVRAEGIDSEGVATELVADRVLVAGSQMVIPVYYTDEVTVIIYIDGVKYRSYYCHRGSAPVVRNHTEFNDNANAPA